MTNTILTLNQMRDRLCDNIIELLEKEPIDPEGLQEWYEAYQHAGSALRWICNCLATE